METVCCLPQECVSRRSSKPATEISNKKVAGLKPLSYLWAFPKKSCNNWNHKTVKSCNNGMDLQFPVIGDIDLDWDKSLPSEEWKTKFLVSDINLERKIWKIWEENCRSSAISKIQRTWFEIFRDLRCNCSISWGNSIVNFRRNQGNILKTYACWIGNVQGEDEL